MIVGRPRLASLLAHIARRAPRVASAWLALLLTLGLVTMRPIAGGSPGLSFAHGAIQWNSADVATTVYTVSGLAFQPKALRFYCMGLGSATDATSSTVHSRRSIGFATSTSDRRAVASVSEDNVGNAACGSAYRTDCVVMTCTSAGAVDGRLGMNSITSDGFTLIVDDAAPVDMTVFWEAWGGTDISVAATLEIAEPAATGTQDYTVTGFEAAGTDQVVMFAGCQETGAAPAASANDSGFMAGFAAGTASGDNIVACGNSDDGSATMDTDGYQLTGECLAMIVVAGGNPNARATLTQWNADGFRLDWLARGVTGRKYIALAIKGGQWRAGNLTLDMTATNNTATLSGLPFAPIGACFVSRIEEVQTAGTSDLQDDFSLGTATGTTSRRTMGVLDLNVPSISDISQSIQYDAVLTLFLTTGTLSAIDINAWNSDGFQLIVDSFHNGAGAATWIGYLAFGDAPTPIPYAPIYRRPYVAAERLP